MALFILGLTKRVHINTERFEGVGRAVVTRDILFLMITVGELSFCLLPSENQWKTLESSGRQVNADLCGTVMPLDWLSSPSPTGRPAFAIVSEEGLMWISSVGRLRSVLARLFDEI